MNSIFTTTTITCIGAALFAATLGCSQEVDGGSLDDETGSTTEATDTDAESGESSTTQSSGDGDGDPDPTGDGDGDPDPTGDGDGDGDGDPDPTGDGDGDPDPTGDGDGDPDILDFDDCSTFVGPGICFTDVAGAPGQAVEMEVHYIVPDECQASMLSQGGAQIDADWDLVTLNNIIPGAQQWIECFRREPFMDIIDYWIAHENNGNCLPRPPGVVDVLELTIANDATPGTYGFPIDAYSAFDPQCQGQEFGDSNQSYTVHVLD